MRVLAGTEGTRLMWARVDDGWWCHPKVMATSPSALGVWITALSWAAKSDTVVVPDAFLRMVGATAEDVAELVAVGMWGEGEGGTYIILEGATVTLRRRKKIPRAMRRAIYERDGHRCVECGATDDLTLDHVIAWIKGGPDTAENLRTLCRPCNSRKGDS